MSDWSPNIALLQSFDDEEWLRVERNYCGRLLAYVSRRVPDVGAREDIVQETFLGSVRGIANFDPVYTFEQYLFGICRNRTIDFLRRRRTVGQGEPADSNESLPGMDELATAEETPSQIVHTTDVASQGKDLLVGVLRDWVQETWRKPPAKTKTSSFGMRNARVASPSRTVSSTSSSSITLTSRTSARLPPVRSRGRRPRLRCASGDRRVER